MPLAVVKIYTSVGPLLGNAADWAGTWCMGIFKQGCEMCHPREASQLVLMSQPSVSLETLTRKQGMGVWFLIHGLRRETQPIKAELSLSPLAEKTWHTFHNCSHDRPHGVRRLSLPHSHLRRSYQNTPASPQLPEEKGLVTCLAGAAILQSESETHTTGKVTGSQINSRKNCQSAKMHA